MRLHGKEEIKRLGALVSKGKKIGFEVVGERASRAKIGESKADVKEKNRMFMR
jgi:hypothetical protein